MGDRLAYLSQRLKQTLVKLKDIQPIKFEIESHLGFGLYEADNEQCFNYTIGLIQDSILSTALTGDPRYGMAFQAATQIASLLGRGIKNEISRYNEWKSQYSTLK